ncbi:hypothetical protein F5884DRAFT_350102 [Xylogone sp. PMI_703]|nr:hypothetical protein F5884DRAFT_350102 [Xylogone sp. PMI_703]
MNTCLDHVLRVPELSRQICGYLNTGTLQALSLVSRQCNSSANVFLFKNIHIKVSTLDRLQADVDRWTQSLEKTSSFKHVRYLKVSGGLVRPGEKSDHPEQEVKLAPNTWATDPDLLLWSDKGVIKNETPDDTPSCEVIRRNDGWKPLAKLVLQLTALIDLFYCCTNQLSPCLLDALHQKYSSGSECRLHMLTFKFRSVTEDSPDPYELALATSPCLYGISTEYHALDIRAKHQEEIVVHTLLHLAPQLKEVRAIWVHYFTPEKYEAITRNRQKLWPNHPLNKEAGETPRLDLKKLEIRGQKWTTINDLRSWQTYTNFSSLRMLKIDRPLHYEALTWAVENCTFSSLSVLVLCVDFEDGRPDRPKSRVWYYHFLGAFLRSLPPLRKLRLYGDLAQSVIHEALVRHGQSLQKLWLYANESHYQVHCDPPFVGLIQKLCPILEELMLPIPRSRGDANEVAIYKTLGAMPRLRKLNLILDSNDWSIYSSRRLQVDPTFDEFDQQIFAYGYVPRKPVLNGHIRDALISCALDEKLSRDIFHCISSGKGSGALPLECLKLESPGALQYHLLNNRDLSGLINRMSRAWLVVRNQRDDARDEMTVTEQSQKIRGPADMLHLRRYVHHGPRSAKLDKIFRRLWPESEDSNGNYRDNWCSLPLSDF